VLLIFGSSKVPQLARSLGSAKREFESGQKEGAPEPAREPTAAE
jgi:TatA/E family protein of Tat protein translocase